MVVRMPAEVRVDLIGQAPLWRGDTLALMARDLPISVCADGANGLTRAEPPRAQKLGLYVPPGATSVPMAAYHPDDRGLRTTWLPKGRGALGLDAPGNGINPRTGEIVGWLMTGAGVPFIQTDRDPAPGYYLSTTALQDSGYPVTDARRYFDAAGTPGWVLPGHDLHKHGVELGDLAWVEINGIGIWCEAFDKGNSGHLLEISVDACYRLGVRDCARNGGAPGGAKITILPGSGRLLGRKPASPEAIHEAGERAALLYGITTARTTTPP
jgi:hypothetical protein